MTTRRPVLLALVTFKCLPGIVLAQPVRKLYRIGYLGALSPTGGITGPLRESFRAGMRDLGYVEGQHYALEARYADGHYERLPALAAELVQSKVDVIVAVGGTPVLRALQAATRSTPVVVPSMADPVEMGFAASLARPGGNITGFTNVVLQLGAKQLEMLVAALPKPSRVALLVNPDNPSNVTFAKQLEPAAAKIGARVVQAQARNAAEIDPAFAALVRERPEACMIVADAVLFNAFPRIAELAAKHRMPCIASYRQYPEAGGLMSYGRDLADAFRRAAGYVDKILKGAKPGDLPIEQPTKFELVINLKTAKALGIKIPEKLLLQADRVIE